MSASLQTRRALREVVPIEWLRPVRITLMFSYLAVYLWWLRVRGLPVDRISVAISVAIFLVVAFLGRSWRTWLVLLADCVAYCLMWLAYERTRGAADDGISVLGLFRIKLPVQVETMRHIDRVLFFGNDPNLVLQSHFWERTVRWYDVVASSVYMTHFVLPIMVMAILWATSHRQWARFMKRFATLLAIGCVMFVLLPTVPPWMGASSAYPQYRFFDTAVFRDAGRGFRHIGFFGFTADYKVQLSNGNGVAAMPSLHASFALIVPAFFLPLIRRRWVAAMVLLFPVMMLAALVYLGEHWVIDGIIGWAITGGCFWFWAQREQRTRTRRAVTARSALGLGATVGRERVAGIPSDAQIGNEVTCA